MTSQINVYLFREDTFSITLKTEVASAIFLKVVYFQGCEGYE